LLALMASGPAANRRAGAAPAAAQPAGSTVDLRGQVVDGQGRAASQLLVFAVERGSSRIVAGARPDPDGLFVMKLPARLHDFGIMSSRWLLGGFERSGPAAIKLVVYQAFPDTDPTDIVREAKSFAKVAAPASDGRADIPGSSIAQITGVVRDETGAPLQGVRLLSMQDSSERLVAVAQTDRQGHYSLVTLAGPSRVFVYAPGLKLKQGQGKGPGQVDLVLTVETQVETITLRTGRRLAFRLSDSQYPEMLPPTKVAVALSFDYGIALSEGCFCPGDLINQPPPTIEESRDACTWSKKQASCASPQRCPASAWARSCMLPQYWWLRLIQLAPPNPSRLRSETDLPTMWWYDAIRAMQESDAKLATAGKKR
jgi:hypothetical protein